MHHRISFNWVLASGLALGLAACVQTPEDGVSFGSFTASAGSSLTLGMEDDAEDETGDGDAGDGDGDTTGDGDGDGDTTGDGDGDTTGDGDGDTVGDGDGDTTTGDGDGDGDLPPNCGWNAGGDPAGYYCGFMGADPNATNPIDCPLGLVEMAACGQITGVGCCDASGDNWYCGDDGMSQFLVKEDCP